MILHSDTNFKIVIIESNSKENCILLSDGKSTIALDLGVNNNKIENAIQLNSLPSISFALLTHEHGDHIKSDVKVNKIFTSKGTSESIAAPSNVILENKWYKEGNWKFKGIISIHNAKEPFAFVIKNKLNKKKIVYFTDSEYFENKQFNKAHYYFVEANYNNQINISPTQVGKHITKVVNHLTLAQAESFVMKHASKKIEYIKFTHISSSSSNNELIKFSEVNLLNRIKQNK